MKKKNGMLLLFLTAIMHLVQAQTQTEQINKTASFNSAKGTQVLSVENIQGFVKVEGYNGNKVLVEAQKIISAKSQDDLQQGLKEVQLQVRESGDSVYVFLDAPFINRKRGENKSTSVKKKEVNYNYHVNISVKVPANTNLKLSTINDGEVSARNITGAIKANNINGPIIISGAAGPINASTINGEIRVSYKANPAADSKFRTINGNIYVHYDEKLNATVAYKTLHGDFYTDLPEVEMLPVKLVKNTNGSNTGTIFKIDRNQKYKVGKGGPALQFETLNGNMYLKKNN